MSLSSCRQLKHLLSTCKSSSLPACISPSFAPKRKCFTSEIQICSFGLCAWLLSGGCLPVLTPSHQLLSCPAFPSWPLATSISVRRCHGPQVRGFSSKLVAACCAAKMVLIGGVQVNVKSLLVSAACLHPLSVCSNPLGGLETL